MTGQLEESGHPIFRSISAFNRGISKKEGVRSTIHFSAESSNIEFLFRTIHSANLLNIYGAVACWCEELVEENLGQTASHVGKSFSQENDQLSKKLDPQEVDLLVRNQTRTRKQLETACRIVSNDSEDWIQKSNSEKHANQQDL